MVFALFLQEHLQKSTRATFSKPRCCRRIVSCDRVNGFGDYQLVKTPGPFQSLILHHTLKHQRNPFQFLDKAEAELSLPSSSTGSNGPGEGGKRSGEVRGYEGIKFHVKTYSRMIENEEMEL